MLEWWTYRPSDFLMFAPRTYWRLFELHNTHWWPAPPLLVMAGGLGLATLWRHRAAAEPWLRGCAAALALAWAFSGWAFVAQRYTAINWAAEGLAWAFAVPALTLALLALRPLGQLQTRQTLQTTALQATTPVRFRAGLLLMLWALVGHPLLAPALGRPLLQAEVWALTPDPTALATLGWLLLVQAGSRGTRWLVALAWVAAVAWCAVSAATLWTMGSAQGWVMAVLALTVLALVMLAPSVLAPAAVGTVAQ